MYDVVVDGTSFRLVNGHGFSEHVGPWHKKMTVCGPSSDAFDSDGLRLEAAAAQHILQN